MEKQNKEIKDTEEMNTLISSVKEGLKTEKEEKIRRDGLRDSIEETDNLYKREKEEKEEKGKALLEEMTKRRLEKPEKKPEIDLEAQKKSLQVRARRKQLEQKGLADIESFAKSMLMSEADVMRDIENNDLPFYRSSVSGEVFVDILVMGGGVRNEPLNF